MDGFFRFPFRFRGDRRAGAVLLDTVAGLAITGLAAAGLLSGAVPLACSLKVDAARSALVGALLEARREAYASGGDVEVRALVGDGLVSLEPGARPRPLGDGVRILVAPADGAVGFRGSGLADNATLEVGCGVATATVVVNQRGVVR